MKNNNIVRTRESDKALGINSATLPNIISMTMSRVFRVRSEIMAIIIGNMIEAICPIAITTPTRE